LPLTFNLQRPKAFLTIYTIPLNRPGNRKKILLTKKPVFIIRMIITLKCHWDIDEETYGIFHYAS
jgi:hypothetical protein